MGKKTPKRNGKRCNYVKQNRNNRNKKRKVDRFKGTEVKEQSYMNSNIHNSFNNITNNYYLGKNTENINKKPESDFIKNAIIRIISIVGSIVAIVKYLLKKM